MVIVAAAAIALIAFTGLVTDVGLVYVQHAHLQRAVDGAAVAAAGQIRAGWSYTDSLTIAAELIKMHNLDPTSVEVYVPPITAGTRDYYETVCGGAPGEWYEDPSLCANPPRKLVRVEATADAHMSFLRVIGFETVGLSAVSEGEAATLDVALVLDLSYSMAWDTGHYQDPADPCPECMWVPTWESDFLEACNQDLLDYFDGDPATVCEPQFYPTGHVHAGEMIPCNPGDPNCCMPCDPMYKVISAARNFIARLREPFDRVAIITFDRDIETAIPMGGGLASATAAVGTLQVYDEPLCLQIQEVAPPFGKIENYWKCMNTNFGGGIAYGSNQFTEPTLRRDESVWVMILLGDGAANVAKGVVLGGNDFCPGDGCCPHPHQLPPGPPYYGQTPAFCRDLTIETRHCAEADPGDCHPGGLPGWVDPNSPNWPAQWSAEGSTVLSDSEDFARDMADFAALRRPHGNGIIIFAIGMGDNVTNEPGVVGEPDAGEKLLRYIANVGFNNEWNATFVNRAGNTVVWNGGNDFDPCSGKPSQESCGNYYYAPANINELNEVFAKIASRIFTRITQ